MSHRNFWLQEAPGRAFPNCLVAEPIGTTVLVGNGYPVGRKSHLSAQLSARKKHDCANSSNQQHYSRTSLGDGRYMFVLIFISLVAFSAIMVGIRQRRENQGGCYQSANLSDAVL